VTLDHVGVVGASLAGLRAVEMLRRSGYDGQVTVVGAETHRPYDRPPLSKQVLAGEWAPERAALDQGDLDADDPDIEWRLGVRAVALDVAARAVELDDGSVLTTDALVIATGAVPRELPGTDAMAGLHTLRTLDDCLALRADFDATPRRVVVVGAGFIGAEVAATARQRGLDVTLVEALPVPLGRVVGDRIGAVFADIHRDHGVDVRLGVGVAAVEGGSRVERVRLGDGTVLDDADVVVVGIGVRPATDWLEGSGLELADGVVCDAACRAAPAIVAAGDVARWPNERFGETMRVEHWDNAIAQGEHAARTLLAGDAAEPYAPVPWFWSDQYDRKIQFAGRAAPDDEVAIVDGSLEERRFVALYGRAGRVVGVLGMNRPRQVMQHRQAIAEGAVWPT
jgi:NADPH-dependent 2,4-dienoyl-CoA reductase/sulfur reductase-like enzyme